MRKITVDTKTIDYSLIKEAADVILKGGVVALPTETVYGLAARTDLADKLYELKQRPRDKAFSYALGSIEKALTKYFSPLPPFGYRLVEKYWPGPLTIIYYDNNGEKIGIRVPSHLVAREILRELDMPVFLPSANLSGEVESVSAKEVENAFNSKIDMIVDGGVCEHSRSSTVLDLTCNPFQVLRQGVVEETDIISVFARKRIMFVCTGNTCRSPMAEFLLKKIMEEEEKPYFQERYEVVSRGIHAFTGSPVSPNVLNVLMEQEGLNAINFTSKKLDRLDVLSADLIFTMEDVQKDYILNVEPAAEGRVFNLKKFLPADEEKDIFDPIGADIEVYEGVYATIKKALIELKDWL